MIKAVIFDMYETLITHYESPLYMGKQIAEDMGISEAKFREIWNTSDDDRTLGKRTLEDVIEEILRVNQRYSPALFETIIAKRKQSKTECFAHIHPEILPLMAALKQKKIKIGLITNCYFEERDVIKDSVLWAYFDAACMSCELGSKKPDAVIFQKCMEELAVLPEECLYIGDGGSYELEAAQSLGMHPLQAVWYFKDGVNQPAKRKPEFMQVQTPMEVLRENKRYQNVNYVEYGQQNKEVILLLHGGGLSWWNYREAAEQLSSVYRVILPILDGHAGSSDDFSTIEENAGRIIRFVEEELGGSVLLMGGVSLGGQILLEILAQKNHICRYALIESALVIPSKFTHAMIRPVFGSCYPLVHQKWFAKLQFASLRIKEALFEEYFRDTRRISKANMIAFLQANALYDLKPSLAACTAKVSVFVGEKENAAMLKSAQRIHTQLQGSSLQILPGMYHGEFSINHPRDYAESVRKTIAGK